MREKSALTVNPATALSERAKAFQPPADNLINTNRRTTMDKQQIMQKIKQYQEAQKHIETNDTYEAIYADDARLCEEYEQAEARG
jgi:hypothetical protein